jgi:hypothetical protein
MLKMKTKILIANFPKNLVYPQPQQVEVRENQINEYTIESVE